MRLRYQLCLFLLILTSCAHSNQERTQESIQVEKDSLIENEAVTIPASEINIKGEWRSKDNALFPIIEFKGKSTVVVKTIMGSVASGYERDEEFIRVRTDKSDLLFEIVSKDSIIGSGFAKGIWIRHI